MLKDNCVIKIDRNVLKRYENNINEGTLFLFNLKTDEVWLGNSSSNDLINLFDGETSLKDVYNEIQKDFSDYTFEELKKYFDDLIEDLLKRNFLEYVNAKKQ